MLAELPCTSPLTLGLDLPSLERWHSADGGMQDLGERGCWLQHSVTHSGGSWLPQPFSLLCMANPWRWHRAQHFPLSCTCTAVPRNRMGNLKPLVGITQVTQTVAKNLRNEHTFEPVPSHRHGVQCLQGLSANALVQQQPCLKDPAKMGLKGKPPDPKLLD